MIWDYIIKIYFVFLSKPIEIFFSSLITKNDRLSWTK